MTVTARRHILLLVILLFLFLLKLTFWAKILPFQEFVSPRNDSIVYHNSARSLLELGTFAMSPETPNLPQTLVPPGYPLILATIYAIFGQSPEIIVIFHIFFRLLTLSMVYRLAKTLFKPQIALLAGMFYTLDVVSFSYTFRVITEISFTLGLMGLLYIGVLFLQMNKSWLLALLLGLMFVITTFIRPISYYLIVPVILAYLMWAIVQKQSWRKVALHLLLLIIPFILLVGGWQLRNNLTTGSRQFSSVGGKNLFHYRAAAIVSLQNKISLDEARDRLYTSVELYQAEHPETKQWTKGQLNDYLMRQGITIIKNHPVLFLRTQIISLLPMFLGGGEGEILRSLNVPLGKTLDKDIFDALRRFDISILLHRFKSGYSVVAFVLAIIYLCVIYSGVLFWFGYELLIQRMILIVHLFVWGVMFYFVFLAAGPEANSRFRLPIMPILAIYAAQGWFLFSRMVKAKIYGS